DAELRLQRTRDCVSRRDLLRLAVAGAVGDVDVEEVQFPVRGGDRAVRRDQGGRVVDAASAATAAGILARHLRDRSSEAPHLPARTEVADAGQLRTLHGPREGMLLAG